MKQFLEEVQKESLKELLEESLKSLVEVVKYILDRTLESLF